MLKKLAVLALVISMMGCDKNQKDVLGCPTKPCTMSFAMVGVQFKDKDGNAVAPKTVTAVNQRTKQSVLPDQQQGPGEVGYVVIIDDSKRAKVATDGDDVLVTAIRTNGQIKTTTYKISGGCNCHVAKVSGPQVITFD